MCPLVAGLPAPDRLHISVTPETQFLCQSSESELILLMVCTSHDTLQTLGGSRMQDVFVCVLVYACVFECVCMCMHVYSSVCVCMCILACTCACLGVCVCVCVCAGVFTQAL